jgi:NTP pyrophosphatase (non-canonical NTP hydrolase)
MYAGVTHFAKLMQHQLDANTHKDGWDDMPSIWLYLRAQEEMGELFRAIREEPNPERLRQEAADVANFLMMVLERRGALPEAGFEDQTFGDAPEPVAVQAVWTQHLDGTLEASIVTPLTFDVPTLQGTLAALDFSHVLFRLPWADENGASARELRTVPQQRFQQLARLDRTMRLLKVLHERLGQTPLRQERPLCPHCGNTGRAPQREGAYWALTHDTSCLLQRAASYCDSFPDKLNWY